MLNELPKKPKKAVKLTPWRKFRRIQKECFLRSVTVYLMYLFMSMLLLATQTIDQSGTSVLELVLGIACIAGGAAYDAHLCYHYGVTHYDNYLTGCLHRKNIENGIPSGGDHREEKEYRPWKGLLIGFYAALIVIIFGSIAGALGADGKLGDGAILALSVFAGWAIVPVGWIREFSGAATANYFLSLLFAIIPVVVSGAFYLIGAYVERKRKDAENARMAAVEQAREEAKNAPRPVHEQTEEQRRKTLQSKKKRH